MGKLLRLPKIERTSTADEVVRLLRHKILSGELPPGSPLTEIPYAASLGVSRNTFREGLRTLAAEGLVRRSVHRGVTVADLADSDVVEIFRLRRMLELAGAEAAGGRASKDFAPMRRNLEDLKRAIAARDWPAVVEHDMAFHRLIVGLLGSPRLESFFGLILSELRPGLALLDRASDNSVYQVSQQHQRILECLERGQQRKCATLLREHLADSERRLRAVLRHKQRIAR